MASHAIKKDISIIQILAENEPSVLEQIMKDSKDEKLVDFWGQSLNFDSTVKKTIVDAKILADLQAPFKIENDNYKVHAGIIHTYGYLFSIIETPYGYKRKRWIEPTLNFGFGLNGQSLSPFAIEGGLLSNVTYFMGALAFTNERKNQLSHLKNVASEVSAFDYSKIKKIRLIESSPELMIITTFVKLPKKLAGDENDYLLIYSVINPSDKTEKLITAFPVTESSFKKTTAANELGINKSISLRYNGYVEGLGNSFTGDRRLIIE